MKIAKDDEKGLMAIGLDHKTLRFARMKYDGSLRCFTNDSVIQYNDFVAFSTKKKAIDYALSIGFQHNSVEQIGNRFERVWGIRHDIRDKYFLAKYE
jgi:hypothetical protein